MTFTKDNYTKEELCKLLNLDKMKDAIQLGYLMEYQKQVGSMKGKTWAEIDDWGTDELGFLS